MPQTIKTQDSTLWFHRLVLNGSPDAVRTMLDGNAGLDHGTAIAPG